MAVTNTLRDKKKDKSVRFGENNNSNVKGQAVKISIPDTGEVVNLFFTDDHADHWFSHAPSAADAVDFE